MILGNVIKMESRTSKDSKEAAVNFHTVGQIRPVEILKWRNKQKEIHIVIFYLLCIAIMSGFEKITLCE